MYDTTQQSHYILLLCKLQTIYVAEKPSEKPNNNSPARDEWQVTDPTPRIRKYNAPGK